MKLSRILPITLSALVGLVMFTRCGSSTSTATTYASTSTKGDFAQWTIDGSNLSATWQITDGTGAITKTLTISATCGAADATYNYKTCTVSSASCANGTSTCGASDAPAAGATFYTFEVPGTAFMVKMAGGGSDELHVGYVLDTSCGGVAGDYGFVHMGNRQTDLFGLYRTNADFSSVQHADFDIRNTACTGATSSGSCTAVGNQVYYSTGTSGGSETVTGASCSNGVRTVTMGGQTVRVMQSQSGIFLIDMPAGQGGILAYKTTSAAALADFANKELVGIAFPDNSGAQLMHASTGAVSGSGSSAGVPITAIAFKDGGTPGMTSPTITANTNATSTATSPAYPDFTAAPQNGGSAYSTNSLHTDYASASAIPGSFRIDGTFGDGGRVLLMAAKLNGKVLALGEVYNWRNTSDSGFTTLTHGTRYYNTGAFILFEK